jgi:hypothetical protein
MLARLPSPSLVAIVVGGLMFAFGEGQIASLGALVTCFGASSLPSTNAS